jgi:hypothetical protein
MPGPRVLDYCLLLDLEQVAKMPNLACMKSLSIKSIFSGPCHAALRFFKQASVRAKLHHCMAVLLLLSAWGSQSAKAQGSQIIYIDINKTLETTIRSYDYITKVDDSLYRFQGDTVVINGGVTIDPQNGRYFFLVGIQSEYKHTVLEYDIWNHSITALFGARPFDLWNIKGFEYDRYSNSILFIQGHELKNYDIGTDSVTPLCNLTTVTDNYDGSYFFGALDDLHRRIYLSGWFPQTTGLGNQMYDIDSCADLDTINYAPNQSLYGTITYDGNTNSYFGMMSDGSIARSDSMGRNSFVVAPSLQNHFTLLNFQQQMYDPARNYFLSPYYWDSVTSKMDVIDLTTGQVVSSDTISLFSNYQRLNTSQSASIRVSGNTLVASYGATYQWLRNGQSIPGAIAQNITPTQTGHYSVQETHLDGRISVSPPIYWSNTALAAAPLTLAQAGFKIFPNPSQKQTTLLLEQPAKNAVLTILDVNGIPVSRVDHLSGESIVLHRGGLSAGIYQFQLLQSGKSLAQGRLMWMD